MEEEREVHLYDILTVADTDFKAKISQKFQPILSQITGAEPKDQILKDFREATHRWDEVINATRQALETTNQSLIENEKNLPNSPQQVVEKTRIEMMLEARNEEGLCKWMEEMEPAAFFKSAASSTDGSMIDIIEFSSRWLDNTSVRCWLVYVLANFEVKDKSLVPEAIGALKDLLAEVEKRALVRNAASEDKKIYHLARSQLKGLEQK